MIVDDDHAFCLSKRPALLTDAFERPFRGTAVPVYTTYMLLLLLYVKNFSLKKKVLLSRELGFGGLEDALSELLQRARRDFLRTGVRGDRGAPLIAASTRASRPSSSLTASSAGVIALGAAPCDDGIESNESNACSMHHECMYM